MKAMEPRENAADRSISAKSDAHQKFSQIALACRQEVLLLFVCRMREAISTEHL
jgi:hypothetical protein